MSATSFADRVVRAAVRRADRHTSTERRDVIKKTALVATALAAAPAEFVLRPRSAYAAVCRCSGQGCPCGSTCCDRYTEFCCTLTGENGCPPGTVAGGWWKVDGSGFCGGSPRYYLDCNSQCGTCGCNNRGVCNGACAGTRCGCAWGDCNNRKTGCTHFRYGQCNKHMRCIGPIVCRVVTCTPPWVFDGSCTTESRTDNNTAMHNAPCLQRPFGGFDALIDVGSAIRVVGWAIDENLLDGIEVRIFVDQSPMVTTMANIYRQDVADAYAYYGANHGFDITIDATPGRHVVCVLAVDQGSGEARFLAFETIHVTGPLGSIDALSATPGEISLIGWIADSAAPTQSASLRVLIDGVEVWSGIADVARSDVAATGAALHSGFALSLASTPGPHVVCVDLVYPNGNLARLACREVVVP